MTTDFRALCADLLQELEHASAWDYQQALKDQARAALAAEPFADKDHFVDVPKMVQPTDQELSDTYWTAWHEHLDRTNSVLHSVGLRAVLARWGTPNSAQVRSSLGDGPAVPESREPASVSEEPTDEDIMALMPQQMHEDLAAAARAMAGFDSPKAAMGAIRNILNCHAVDHARAVLARWGSAN